MNWSKMKPFIKWAGGKTKILKELHELKPQKYHRYFEPFLGGGAFFLSLKPQHAILNDKNVDLIDTWKVLCDFEDKLITDLMALRQKEINLPYYNMQRAYFNFLKAPEQVLSQTGKIYKSSLFIWLNKASFGGLYRVNKKGLFNNGWSNKPDVTFDTLNLRKVSDLLKETTIKFYAEDYLTIFSKAQKGDFVYLDPPYAAARGKVSHTSYTNDGFDAVAQQKLIAAVIALHRRGCYVMLSNNDLPWMNEIYQKNGFNVTKLQTYRSINSKSIYRKNNAEVIIRNYE